MEVLRKSKGQFIQPFIKTCVANVYDFLKNAEVVKRGEGNGMKK